MLLVSPNIAYALLGPVFFPGLRSNPAILASMHMPKAAVDEDDLAMAEEYNIWTPRQISSM